ncbi:hypothetical protein [Rickettsia endosymbiont of Aspidapion aeneum]|uniref:hypothetical protein n=1 Tax=Rickettsia endosymbiont of Aspidapion aeneum TaxID=3066247 RepID=UPI00313E4FD8
MVLWRRCCAGQKLYVIAKRDGRCCMAQIFAKCSVSCRGLTHYCTNVEKGCVMP